MSGEQKEKIINIGFIVGVLVKRWYIFAVSILIAVVSANLYIKYSTPIYKVSTNVLIKDKSTHSYGTQKFLEGLELFQSFRNIENEMIFLKSTTLVKRAVDRLDFGISYYHQGQVVDNELYSVKPFEVILDSSTAQIVGVPFNISFLSDSTYRITMTGFSLPLYDVKKQIHSDYRIPGLNINQVHKVGEYISIQNSRFKIVTKSYNLANLIENSYYFIIWDKNNLVRSYKSKIVVKPVKNEASILEISSQGPVIQKEIDFINELAYDYIQEGLEEKNQIASNTIDFIDVQLGTIKDSLSLAEDELETFRTKNKVVDVAAEYTGDMENLRALEMDRAIIEMRLKYYHYLVEYVRSNKDIDNITIPSAIGIDDPLLTNLIAELAKLSQEKAALSYSVQQKNPYSSILELKIKNTKESLEEDIFNIEHAEKIKHDEITEQIRKLSSKIDMLPKTERLLINLKRKFDLSDNIYNYLLEKRAEASIAKASNISDSKVIDYATTYDVVKIFPLTNKIYFAAVLIGIIVPLGGVFLFIFFDNRLKDREQLLRLTSIPLLGVIGHNKFEDEDLVTAKHPKAGITETFRSARINLNYIAPEDSKIIGITSTISGEGKSFCAVNIATILATANKKVLLIGADLRKPKIFNQFRMDHDSGLSTFLIKKATFEEVVQKTFIEGLDVIIAGPIPPNPSELLGLKLMNELIEKAKQKYDYIIIDTPPIGVVSDYLVIKKYIDVHIYVVRFNYSKMQYIQLVNELYTDSKLNPLCILANDAKQSRKGYGYSYGYGYYEDHSNMPGWIEKIKNKIRRSK